MLGPEYLIGMTMTIVEVIKRYLKPDAVFIPLLVVAVATALNLGNAALFGGDMLAAVKAGMENAMLSAGIYGLGKALIEKQGAA